MDIFNVLTMIGGLCLFLFGMNLMGQALERRAGGKLQSLLDKMTGSVPAGFFDGPRHHSHHSKLVGDDSHGSGLRKLRAHDTAASH